MIFDRLLREREIHETMTNISGCIKNCKTDKGIGLLEDLEISLIRELNHIQNWLNDY